MLQYVYFSSQRCKQEDLCLWRRECWCLVIGPPPCFTVSLIPLYNSISYSSLYIHPSVTAINLKLGPISKNDFFPVIHCERLICLSQTVTTTNEDCNQCRSTAVALMATRSWFLKNPGSNYILIFCQLISRNIRLFLLGDIMVSVTLFGSSNKFVIGCNWWL